MLWELMTSQVVTGSSGSGPLLPFGRQLLRNIGRRGRNEQGVIAADGARDPVEVGSIERDAHEVRRAGWGTKHDQVARSRHRPDPLGKQCPEPVGSRGRRR